MNALNAGKRDETRTLPPLVVDANNGLFIWVEKGLRFHLFTSVGQWHPIADGVGFGGRVLPDDQVDALVAEFGRPLP